MRILKALLYAVAGAVVLGALVFGGGFLLAAVLGESGAALGMLVPMVLVPAAAVIGAVLGAIKGWRAA